MSDRENELSAGTEIPLNTINWVPAQHVPTLFVSYQKV